MYRIKATARLACCTLVFDLPSPAPVSSNESFQKYRFWVEFWGEEQVNHELIDTSNIRCQIRKNIQPPASPPGEIKKSDKQYGGPLT